MRSMTAHLELESAAPSVPSTSAAAAAAAEANRRSGAVQSAAAAAAGVYALHESSQADSMRASFAGSRDGKWTVERMEPVPGAGFEGRVGLPPLRGLCDVWGS